MLSGLSALVRALETIWARMIFNIDPSAQLGSFLIIYLFSCVRSSLNGWNIAISNGCSSWVEWVGRVRISSPTSNPYNTASLWHGCNVHLWWINVCCLLIVLLVHHGESLHSQVEHHVRDKFATPILYGIDNFNFYDIFSTYT